MNLNFNLNNKIYTITIAIDAAIKALRVIISEFNNDGLKRLNLQINSNFELFFILDRYHQILLKKLAFFFFLFYMG